jgi:hypothetical protein
MSSTETQVNNIELDLTNTNCNGSRSHFGSCNTQYDFSRSSLIFSNKVKILATVLLDWYDYRTISFTTLVVGIAKLGNVSAVGRIGKGFRLVFTALISLLLGMFL